MGVCERLQAKCWCAELAEGQCQGSVVPGGRGGGWVGDRRISCQQLDEAAGDEKCIPLVVGVSLLAAEGTEECESPKARAALASSAA